MLEENEETYQLSAFLTENLPTSILWYVVIIRQQVFQKEIYSYMFKQEKMQQNLEAIVENLEEALIMVNGNSIEYINN